MTLSVAALSFDSPDALAIAQFWAAVLGREIRDDASAQRAVLTVGDVVTTGPMLIFHQVPEGKSVKNRLHLDLASGRLAAESERLISLGATRLHDGDDGRVRWTTFADPDGNEFDVVSQ